MAGSRARRALPRELKPLYDLAHDLRWAWCAGAEDLWRTLDAEIWAASRNPKLLLREISDEQLARFAADPDARRELARLDDARRRYLGDGGWFAAAHPADARRGVAYFSMEFGLGEALPLYAGGLGVLAGDTLKAASDLGVPLAGVGLLYQEGYFRQSIDADGAQHAHFPYSAPGDMPVEPERTPDGRWLQVELEFPGRTLRVRVWRAQVGRVPLYLLDTNDPLNSPVDRGITAKLYAGDPSVQFLQAAVLGIAGWRALEALGVPVDVCHLNEGHAALAVLERARSFAARTGLSFQQALWATRAGNVFTTHTAVAAAFDRFGPAFLKQYLPYLRIYVGRLGISLDEVLALGRVRPEDPTEPFNLAYLAMRGCATVSAVSALHGVVSRALFRELYPRWPHAEVPVTHVTNGVHVPTWRSATSERFWREARGDDREPGDVAAARAALARVPDESLWAFRAANRRALVDAVRVRLARQLGCRGADAATVERAGRVFDPDALTLGFARRFATYKRPTLLLTDRARLARLLADPGRPVQLVVAGKAHPNDAGGQALIQQCARFAADEAVRDRVAFLEDYDIALAKELVGGVDVWINTPRRPWEASGTSGMKVVANGGVNVSSLDGWWAEAYASEVGWAIGDAATGEVTHDAAPRDDATRDAAEAEQLYGLLEQAIVPEFYERDARGLPTRWIARLRASVGELTPRFGADRMVREYVEQLYLPAAASLARRTADEARVARELAEWHARLACGWDAVAFGTLDARRDGDGVTFAVPVQLGALDPRMVRVELYAEAIGPERPAQRVEMRPTSERRGAGEAIPYAARVATERPASDFTPRVIPFHADARVPAEAWQIRWQR